MSDLEHNNVVGKISLKDVDSAIAANESTVNVPVAFVSAYTAVVQIENNQYAMQLDFPGTVQMTNGGTGPYKSSLLLATSGRGHLPPSIVLGNPKPPYNVTILLDNFFGRQFNSLNDIKVHPSGKFFFTDTV